MAAGLSFCRQGMDRETLLYVSTSLISHKVIKRWPTPSETAETVLFRLEGNEIVFLNESRNKKNTALNLRFSKSEPNLPSAMGVRGIQGVVEGIDYQGVPVFATVKPVPDSPWYLTAKISKEEIYAPLRERFWLVTIFVFTLIAAAGAGIGLIWRNQAAESYRKQYQMERERQMYAQRYEYLTKYANDIILLSERNGRIIDANECALNTYGYDRNEILRLNLPDLWSSETKAFLSAELKAIEEHDGMIYETQHQRKDGSVFAVEVSSRVTEKIVSCNSTQID